MDIFILVLIFTGSSKRERIVSMKRFATLILILAITVSFKQDPGKFICRDGEVHFISDAPLELIKATSTKLTGALDLSNRNFSFKVSSESFHGFNTSLQRIHFNEDFLESEIFPNSTFKGKIIEEIDFTQPGQYTIRAKGILNIHGINFDRIIRCVMIVSPGKIEVTSKFTVFLDNHDISIPTIVNQKIAEEINVEIKLTLIPI